MKRIIASLAMGLAATASLSLALLSGENTSAVADPWTQAPTTMHLIAPPNLPDAVARISRNPFSVPAADAGKPDVAGPTTPGAATVQPPLPALAVAQTGAVTPAGLVPNPGGDVSVAAAGGMVPDNGSAMISVIGTVIGNGHAPVALVHNGTEIDYVHVGDYLGTRRVTAILAQGIEFDDGSRLAIATTSNPEQRKLTKPVESTPPSPGLTNGPQTPMPAAGDPLGSTRARYVPLSPGALPTINASQTSLPTVTSAPYDSYASISPYNVATPDPNGTPHYNSTTPVPAPTPPTR
jgi:hypothetical protein